MSQDQSLRPSNPSRREWEDQLPGVLLWRRAPRLQLTLEALILYVVVPVALYFGRQEFATMIIPTLLVMGLGCGLALALDPLVLDRVPFLEGLFGFQFFILSPLLLC